MYATSHRRTLPPCLMVTAFAAAVALYNTYAVLGPHQLPGMWPLHLP